MSIYVCVIVSTIVAVRVQENTGKELKGNNKKKDERECIRDIIIIIIKQGKLQKF